MTGVILTGAVTTTAGPLFESSEGTLGEAGGKVLRVVSLRADGGAGRTEVSQAPRWVTVAGGGAHTRVRLRRLSVRPMRSVT